MDTITVSLIPTSHLSQILLLVKILNPSIEEDILARRLEEMVGQGYRCAGAYQGGMLVGICGLWIATRFYCGKYIEPDNVVVHPDYRSLGVGQKLMAWVYDYAQSLNCNVVELNSYVSSLRAHKFYFNEGFQILGFHFQKRLGEE
ncbi:MAG: GNAT family N-acetyltransferase [Janthinobacterium lividum]